MWSFLRNRRAILCGWLALAGHATLGLAEDAHISSKCLLQDKSVRGDVWQVQSIIEASGRLKINPDGKKLTHLPIAAKGELQFVEKVTAEGRPGESEANSPRRSVRYYQSTAATSQIGEKSVSSQLAEDRRFIGVQAATSDVTLYSPLGPLTRDELELIDVQANTLLLGRLLPGREVAAGEKWSHDDALTAALFNLDVVTDNQLKSTFLRTEGDTAFLAMSGRVEGSVAGVVSQLDVTAKYQVHIASGRVEWLAMSIKEDRAVGHAEPGFEITARLRVAIIKTDPPAELSDEVINSLPMDVPAGLTMLTFASDVAGIQFVHDRNWKVMVDRHDVSILRLVERGDLIAQCNISRLPDALPDKQLNISSFQADIRRVLDKNFGQFIDASEAKSERGVRILRTIVAGIAADLPIQWNYYHLTDSAGRQASLVFTMDGKLVERFGAADQPLIASFEFTGRPGSAAAAKTAKPAGTPAAEPTKTASSSAKTAAAKLKSQAKKR